LNHLEARHKEDPQKVADHNMKPDLSFLRADHNLEMEDNHLKEDKWRVAHNLGNHLKDHNLSREDLLSKEDLHMKEETF